MWAGDSRIYMLRNGKLSQLSRDHTEMQDLLDRGLLTLEEAAAWPRRNVITRAIGAVDDPALDIAHGQIQPDDKFLICSDGLTAHVSDDEIGSGACREIAGAGLRQPDRARAFARRNRQRDRGHRSIPRGGRTARRISGRTRACPTASPRVILATRLDPGVQLNDTYEIDERIASGGMGEVYRGHNIQTGEPVAIKTILPELADQEAIFALFKKEATVLGRLHHDTIVRYYSFSRDPRLGRPYLAMEFVDGVSLADRMKAQPLTPDEVRKLFTGVADGLALAHGAGVIHRDLSPDNIILRDGDVGRPKLIDFGIARSANIGEGTLIGGGFAGKFNFVSPEQLGIHSREVDARSDIYSLGLVIAASLRGQPIDMGGSHVEVIEKRTKVPDLSDIDESAQAADRSHAAAQSGRPAGRCSDGRGMADGLWRRRSSGPSAANGGFGAPTGAHRRPFRHPARCPAHVPPAMQTGTPFASADPTQLLAPKSAPAPSCRRQPPRPASESPFGPAAAYPAASPPPGTVRRSRCRRHRRAGTARQKSGAGRYAHGGRPAAAV